MWCSEIDTYIHIMESSSSINCIDAASGNGHTNAADTSVTIKQNPLEQFVLLAKSTKGAACADLIQNAIEAPGVYVFGELLAMPNVLEVSAETITITTKYNIEELMMSFAFMSSIQLKSGSHEKYYNTLNAFAYCIYSEYRRNQEHLISLTDVMKRKLQYLTIVTMAQCSKCIRYEDLLTELDIGNVRDLEDLIIESIYSGIHL